MKPKRGLEGFGTLLWAVSFLISASAAPEDHRITALPGISQDLIKFKQYSGYVQVDEGLGKNLFYWFVESQNDPQKDPLILWLNGGPGASSIGYGFFMEHGPFRVDPGGQTLSVFDWSWNRIASVLYLESPAGVGFSHASNSTGTTTDDTITAANTYTFLKKWFDLYPEHKKNNFYVAGESYGGHYCPQLAAKILEGQKSYPINMKGLLLGNPGIDNDWYYNVNEYAFVTFMFNHGFIPQPAYSQAVDACGWEKFLTNCEENYENPSEQCKNATSIALKYLPPSYDPYDINAPTCLGTDRRLLDTYTPFLRQLNTKYGIKNQYDPCLKNYVETYLNLPEVQKAIHAEPKRWEPLGGVAYGSMAEEIVPYFRKFLKEAPEWRIAVVSGDTDAAVPFVGTLRWVECMGLDVKQDWGYWKAGGTMGGAYKVYDKDFTLMTVHGCGHTISYYCPAKGYYFFENWLQGAIGNNTITA